MAYKAGLKEIYGVGKTQEERDEENKKRQKAYEAVRTELNIKSSEVDDDYINQYIEDCNNFSKATKTDFNNIGYNNYKSSYRKYLRQSESLSYRANRISEHLQKNKDRYDSKTYNDLMTYLDNGQKSFITARQSFSNARDYYAQWKTEKDYKDYLEGEKEREKALSFDTKRGRDEISVIDRQIESLEKAIAQKKALYNSRYASNGDYASSYNPYANPGVVTPVNPLRDQDMAKMAQEIADYEKQLSDLKKQRTEKNTYYNTAKRLQDNKALTENATNAEDFELYADKGINNEITQLKNKYSNTDSFGEDATLTKEQRFAKYLTDDELNVYEYYIGKGDTKSAEAYLDSMEYTVNDRRGLEIYDLAEDKIALELAFGVAAGLDQFGTGIKSSVGSLFGGKDYYAPSAIQLASARIREDLADEGFKIGDNSLAQIGYDLITTTSNMLPSILTSAVVAYGVEKVAPGAGAFAGEAVGSFLLGTSAAGNAYAEMINLGYDKKQARTYGTMIGASEAGLQLVMGGIGKLGGYATKGLTTKIVGSLDNALAKGAIKFGDAFVDITKGTVKLGGKMFSEGAEEYMQEILEPFFKNLAFNEKNEIKLFTPEALYSGVLGALSAGVLDAVPSSARDAFEAMETHSRGDTAFKKGVEIARLKELGQTFSADSVAYKIADRVNKDTGAYTIGKLLNEVGAEITQQNQADITNALTEKGVAPKNAETISKWLARTVDGVELSRAQRKVLENNEVVSDVFRDVIIDKNSTVNQRRQSFFEATKSKGFTGVNQDVMTSDSVRDNYNSKLANNESAENVPLVQSSTEQRLRTASGSDIEADIINLANEVANNGKTSSQQSAYALYADPATRADLAIGQSDIINSKSKSTRSVEPQEYDVSAEGKTILNTQNGAEDVEIKGVALTKGKVMTLELADGRKVNSKDIAYRSQDEAIVYETVANMEVPTGVADVLIKNYSPEQSGSVYAFGVNQAYKYGYLNMPKAELMTREFFARGLTDIQIETAYNLGKGMGKADFKTTSKKKGYAKGGVIFDGDRSKLTYRQKTSLEAMEKVADLTGVQIRVFESDMVNGKRQGKNGSYKPSTGEIGIDLFAGADGQGIMLHTLAHELVHHIREQNAEEYKVLADFLMEQYGKKGISVDALVRRQMEKAKASKRIISYAEAHEEVIADSMETMLTDGKAIEKLQMLQAKDPSLFEKIKSAIAELIAKIKKAYKNVKPETLEGQIVASMLDEYETIQQMFVKALAGASENFKNAKVDNSEKVSDENKFSLRGTNENGIEVYETSEDILKLPWKERKTRYLDLMKNEFRGRTAKFERNGHYYYAEFDRNSLSKAVYGEKRSDKKGHDALVNIGADGDVFDLVENSRYTGSAVDKKNHPKADYFDYFVKTVQINNTVFDVLADVQKQYGKNGGYVYTIKLTENKSVKASPIREGQEASLINSGNALTDKTRIPQNGTDVNTSISEKGVKYSDRYSELHAMNVRINELREQRKAIMASEEYNKVVEETMRSDDTDKAMKSYFAFLENSGLKKVDKELAVLEKKAVELRDELNKETESELSSEREKAIAESGLSEAEYDKKQAIKEFGYTPYYYDAGYILDNGKMLNFSGEKGKHFGTRGEDHRGISRIFNGTLEGTASMIKFMNEGNIRIMDETPGLDISVMPTKEQFTAIRKYVNSKKGEVAVDISDAEGRNISSVFYDKGTSADWIILDIKEYFEKGKIPEQEDVRYSDRDSKGRKLSAEQLEYFKNSKVRDKNGNLLVVYHGTPESFTVFRNRGSGMYFTADPDYAYGYTQLRGKVMEQYINITKPFDILNDEDAKNIFVNEFIKGGYAQGINPSSSVKQIDEYIKNGVDWVEGDNLIEFLEENEYDYDGLILNEGSDSVTTQNGAQVNWRGFSYVIFEPNQTKNVDNLKPTKDNDIRYSERNYSYDALVSKPDMKVTTLYDFDQHDRKDVVKEAKKNATSVGKANSDGSVSVYVNDIDREVIVSTKAIRHSLDSRSKVNIPVVLKIGEILKNSIKINELNPREENISQSYVLMGMAKNPNNEPYIVSFVVNSYTNTIDTVDVLYSANAKKEPAGIISPRVSTPSTGSAISIRLLLDFVNKYFSDILPEDVLRHYGHVSRPDGKLGESALFSDRDPDALTPRNLLANALEESAVHEVEKKKLAEYKANIEKLYAIEQELYEVRKEIKELSFAPGKRDTAKLKALQDKAVKLSNSVTFYDKKLLNLESTSFLKNVLEREKQKVIKRQKEKDAELLRKQKEKALQKEKEIAERYRESRKKSVESRNRTAMRNKIKRVVNELNQYLLHGTKDKHVMDNMKKVVAEALNVLDMDTVGADERVERYNQLIAEATDPDVIASLTETRDRIQGQGDNLNEKLMSLKNAYADIINSTDPVIANAYDKVIEDKIQSVAQSIEGTSLRNMSLTQLEEVYDLYKMVLTNIRDSNKAFKAGRDETISELGYKVNAEVEDVTEQKYKVSAFKDYISKFGWNELKPIYAFRMIGSQTFQRLFNNILRGQDTWYRDVEEGKTFQQQAKEKYGYREWDFKKNYNFEAKNGKTFDLTLQQIMSLYAFSRREQALNHLVQGGIVLDSDVKITERVKGIPVKYKVNTSDAFNLSPETIGEIIDSLTPEQKSFVEEMQSFLSDVMGEKGNEVSLAMYGIKLYKEKFYFPLKSSEYYMNFTAEEAGEVKLKNSGFSKETVKKANNPIVLSDFMDVWAKHVNEMSTYHAFVLPIEDFSRVYNYRTPSSETSTTTSLKNTLNNAFGSGVNKYIRQMLVDVNGGARSTLATPTDKITSLAKKGAVMLSASVVIQQPSAIVRAMAYVKPRHFVNFESLKFAKHNEKWQELKKYAPIAGIKEMGYFDTGMGRSSVDWITEEDYSGIREKLYAFFHDSDARKALSEDILGKAPAMADELSWVALWEAVKKETSKETELEPDTDEFLKRCGERFTEVVELTQVYDSVLSRNGYMRDKGSLMKMATAFMAEPTIQANMLLDAGVQRKRNGRAGRRSASAVVGAVTGSILLNTLLKSLVYAARDDEEDKTLLEKYIGAVVGDLTQSLNPLTMIPFAKDIISIFSGYDVERMDMSLVADLKDSILAIGSETETTSDKITGLISSIGQLLGVPVKNVIRDAKAIVNVYNSITNGTKTTDSGIMFTLKEEANSTITGNLLGKVAKISFDTSSQKKYYEAVMSGDKVYAERMESLFKNPKNGIVDTLKKYEPRILEAAQAEIDGKPNERYKIAKEIVADGFKQDYVILAIQGTVSNLTKEEKENKEKKRSLSTVDNYFASALNGDVLTANEHKEAIIQTEMYNTGKTYEEAEKKFYNAFRSAVKDAINAKNLTVGEASEMFEEFGDLDAESAYEKSQYLAFKRDYPELEYDWTENTVTKYYEVAEPVDISVEAYDEYMVGVVKCKGVDANNDGRADTGTVKKEKLEVIDSLPLNNYQKDVLYRLNGWSEKTIWEAPWR